MTTVIFSYALLGFVSGNDVANDGRWAAAFLSNFHFENVGTNYFTASRAPSPLQNFWSLSVEEQFYFVYPTLFLVLAKAKVRLSLRTRLTFALVIVIVISYWLSVAQTTSHPLAAYFSPFTRAWELALGALVAVGTPWLKRIPSRLCALLSWLGLLAILVPAFAFSTHTAYPGSLVAVPVVGAATIIAAGTAIPRLGTESLLGLSTFRWLGQRSYSLYLWHWPILIIFAENAGKTTLPVSENILLVLLALAISVVTFRVIERPIRHWRLTPKQSLVLGMGLSIVTIGLLTVLIYNHSVSTVPGRPVAAASSKSVTKLVERAAHIQNVPTAARSSLQDAPNDWGGYANKRCTPTVAQSSEPICILGDRNGKQEMVILGDSHALMWLEAFNSIAMQAHWKLVDLGKPSCPADLVTPINPPGFGPAGGPYTVCNQWHRWAIRWINRANPNLLVITQESNVYYFTANQWRKGMLSLLKSIKAPKTRKVILGNIPVLPEAGPTCLAAHIHDIQACSAPRAVAVSPFTQAERSAALSGGAGYIDTTPWFCSATCTAIVGNYDVYLDQKHLTATYSMYLRGVLAQALFNTSSSGTSGDVPSDLFTGVGRPQTGATLSGGYWLVAQAASDNAAVTKVEFRVTGGLLRSSLIGTGTKSPVGWLAHWNTATVGNGTYEMQSVAYDSAGKSIRSKPIWITVNN